MDQTDPSIFVDWLAQRLHDAVRDKEPVDSEVVRAVGRHVHADPSWKDSVVTNEKIAAHLKAIWKDDNQRRDFAKLIGREVFELASDLAAVTMDSQANEKARSALGAPMTVEWSALPLAQWLFNDPAKFDATRNLTAAFAWPFSVVFREELREIARRRASVSGKATSESTIGAELVGLAFSGGGIRSATFNLGVLQRLAEHGLLTSIDYLSTVSGGGYIAAWLAAWSSRKENFAQVADWLSPTRHRDPAAPHLRPVRFLRWFSNYLTPRVGTFSFDTWAMIAVYTRNVLLNLSILMSLFGALLLLPRITGHFWLRDSAPASSSSLLLGLGAIGLAVVTIGAHLFRMIQTTESDESANGRTQATTWRVTPIGVQLASVAPLLIGSYLLAQWAWTNIGSSGLQTTTWRAPGGYLPLLILTLLSLTLSFTGGMLTRFRQRLRFDSNWWSVLLVPITTAPTVLAGWGLWVGYIALLGALSGRAGGAWHALVWGPPLFLAILSIAGLLQIGLLGIAFPDAGREWLSRFRGVTNIYSIGWVALFGIAVYGPLLFVRFELWVSAVGVGWIVITVVSFLGGQRAAVKTSRWLELAIKIGPPVFVVGFVWAIAVAEHLLFAHAIGGSPIGDFPALDSTYWESWNRVSTWDGPGLAWPQPGLLALLATGVALLLAWRIDINEFSMHHFYKNRLVRCYLGASNKEREPNSFTGFDERDDVALSKLKPSDGYNGPYAIVNATVNLTAGSNLAWQERKGASFIFTPCFSGFDPTVSVDDGTPSRLPRGLEPFAYRRTERYGFKDGIRLGTAMAISGAAADPNQGYNTSPALAFLMTVFNVRLGWWLGNPRSASKSQMPGPVFGLAALVSELTGNTNDLSNFVNLSDGGHFDNLGLYELVRRKCRYIIACDAEQDARYTFGGLGMAIRKCRIDFGAEIAIDPEEIAVDPERARSAAHCTMGRIRYSDKTCGHLLYIKASLTGDEPEDLLQYAASHPDFPHESTTDQWFSESQFESYRRLGYEAADSALSPARQWSGTSAGASSESDVGALFTSLKDHWAPVNPNLRLHAITHTKTLNEMMHTLRSTPSLWALGAELFPRGYSSSGKLRAPEAEFYFCMTLIQLVEDIYFDFNLDDPRWRDDPRIEGWTTLFKQWQKVPGVQAAWNSQEGTYRQDFRNYWNGLCAEVKSADATPAPPRPLKALL